MHQYTPVCNCLLPSSNGSPFVVHATCYLIHGEVLPVPVHLHCIVYMYCCLRAFTFGIPNTDYTKYHTSPSAYDNTRD